MRIGSASVPALKQSVWGGVVVVKEKERLKSLSVYRVKTIHRIKKNLYRTCIYIKNNSISLSK